MKHGEKDEEKELGKEYTVIRLLISNPRTHHLESRTY